MPTDFLVPAGLFLLCLLIRTGYELLKESHKIDMENKALFVLIFLSMCTLWGSWFALCPADPYRIDVPGPLQWAGAAVLLSATVLAVGALVQLRGVENIRHLVTTGFFRKVRHPMYVGFIGWILGSLLYHGAVTGAVLAIPGVVSVLWWRHLEEGRLTAQFGERYTEYKLASWF
jgi:protein-S-isoprenylcysteine O-methyltransferase Ste14